ncbi:tRNA lysidine(34) synthetase TilS [Gilvibacter sp.]|uniref:tRNA lysidine(34) synthetase TilS n=1 Tax=Gilvibacter sp. TaxID=2729997 RepID=UPI003F49E450
MLDSFSAQFGTILPSLDGKRILLAVSGGLDSCVLLDLMRRQAVDIAVAHCNYQLRGDESNADHQLVKQLAKKHNLVLHDVVFDTKTMLDTTKESLQMLARRLRYSFFDDLCDAHGYDYVMTAHHADDALETFLMNWSRGSGVKGLEGIPRQNGTILRPLLDFDRQVLLQHANANDLQWREDSSNASEAYLRNQVRLTIVPALKEVFPNITDKLRETQQHLQQANELISAYMQGLEGVVWNPTTNGLSIDLTALSRVNSPNGVLYQLLSPFGFTDWDAVYRLPIGQSGTEVRTDDYQLLKDRELLILQSISSKSFEHYTIESSEQTDHLPIDLHFEQIDALSPCDKNTLIVDADLLKWPLKLRTWQAADRFFPFGMQGSQKLSDYFINQKISRLEKEKIWLLCSDSKIVWVVGHRADDRFKVSNNTKNLLQITWRD